MLQAFLEDPAAPRYGYDLMKAAGLKSGTLYPMLSRLEHEKLVTSGWETTPQRVAVKPSLRAARGSHLSLSRSALLRIAFTRQEASLVSVLPHPGRTRRCSPCGR
jgi:DNA-binding IclR family transcriptional regulator